jgi:hypothetical protein
MDKLNNARELLKNYIKNTPKEVLAQKFTKYNNAVREGNTLFNYFSSIENAYSFFDAQPKTKEEKILVEDNISLSNQNWTEIIFTDDTNEVINLQKIVFTIENCDEINLDNDNYIAAA